MMRILTSENADEHTELMEKIWRFRHHQFVERLGWKELQAEDGREIDRFDNADAIHLPVLRDGEVAGYTRLLRTSGPHLLSDVYPEIMGGLDWPRADDVYEWTRCISDEHAGRFGDVQASHVLITGVLEFCLTAGIKGLIVETHPKLVTWMLETGYKVQTLATPSTINDVPVVPVFIGATPAALDRHHAMFGIGGSVLSIDEGLANPVGRVGALQHLPGLAVPSAGLVPDFLPEVDFAAMRETPSGKSN